MGSRNCTLLLNLMEGTKLMGKLVIRAEPASSSSNVLYNMNFEGHKLGKSYCCFKERPFFTIAKRMTRQATGNDERQKLINSGEDEEWLKVYESELGRGSSVYFNQVGIRADKLCSNDLDLPLRVSFLLTLVSTLWIIHVH